MSDKSARDFRGNVDLRKSCSNRPLVPLRLSDPAARSCMRPRDTIVAVSFALLSASAFAATAFELEINGARPAIRADGASERDAAAIPRPRRKRNPGEPAAHLRGKRDPNSLEAHGYYDVEVTGRLETHAGHASGLRGHAGEPVLFNRATCASSAMRSGCPRLSRRCGSSCRGHGDGSTTRLRERASLRSRTHSRTTASSAPSS